MNQIRLLTNGNLYCESGVMVSTLMNFCENHGFGGLEYLSGIPATLGGICYMNAGVAGRYISESIKSVTVFDGNERVFTNEDCNFRYKNSTMREINCLILGCELTVCLTSSSKIRQLRNYYLDRRKDLPVGKSCGCVFKNFENKSAGKIIESAGLKGCKVGGAMVSEKHANFIINNGTCSQDVYKLITYVKRIVYEKFAIALEEEVCYIGDFK